MLARLKLLFCFPAALWAMLVTYLPGAVGNAIRYRYWQRRLKHLGRATILDTGVHFTNPGYISIGASCWIDKNVIILAGVDNKYDREKVTRGALDFPGEPGVVYIGDYVHLAPRVLISGISGGVYISDRCGLAADTKVYALVHMTRSAADPSRRDVYLSPLVPPANQCVTDGPVYLGPNTAVALNSVVLPGVSLPQDCFVAMNSVVYPALFPPNALISGNPARRVGERFMTSGTTAEIS